MYEIPPHLSDIRLHDFLLVGEAAGKAPLGVAKKEDVNISQLRGKADSASGVINETRMVFRMRFF